jgi:TctA family transporter
MLGPLLARVREDRLLRWSAYASVPALWFSIALLNPFLLAVPPLTYFAIRHAMRRGWVERNDPVEDPDFF